MSAFILYLEDGFCSLDTYHLIIFAQIPQKKLEVLDVGLFLHLIFFFLPGF